MVLLPGPVRLAQDVSPSSPPLSTMSSQLTVFPPLLLPENPGSSRSPRLPIHSHTRLTSPPLNSLELALTFAFFSTTARTRVHIDSLLRSLNSSLNTSSRSWPTLTQLSEASPREYSAAWVASLSNVVPTSVGTRAASARFCRIQLRAYAKEASTPTTREIAPLYLASARPADRLMAHLSGRRANDVLARCVLGGGKRIWSVQPNCQICFAISMW